MQDKNETFFKKRIQELARTACQKGIPQYTGFLDLNEQSILHSMNRETGVRTADWGGYEDAERKMFAFYDPDSSVPIQFPLCCVEINALNERFSDHLTHRDYLGAMLNLGIDRSLTGDILAGQSGAYVFCALHIAGFLTEELRRVRHTSVTCRIIEFKDSGYVQQYETMRGTVSSLRIDSILSVACRESRSSLTGLISGGKVFVNGRAVLSNSFSVEEGDIISVRGTGKFRLEEITGRTKKDRIGIVVLKYS